MAEKKQIDWEKIELDYRAGIKTLRQIGEENGVTDGAIRKRAKRDDWSRDLSAKINKKAEDLVRKQEVRKEVRKESAYSEKEIIDANAQAIVDIRLSHRKDIAKSRTLAMRLLDELEHQTINIADYDELGELLRNEDEKGMDKLNDLYMKVISTPSRIISMQKLADTFKTLIGLEREAFNIDKEINTTKDPLTTLLENISKTSNNGFGIVEHDPEIDEDMA